MRIHSIATLLLCALVLPRFAHAEGLVIPAPSGFTDVLALLELIQRLEDGG